VLDDLFADGAVVDRIGDVVALSGRTEITEEGDVHQDVLAFFALPIVDADNAAQQQVPDDDAIHFHPSFPSTIQRIGYAPADILPPNYLRECPRCHLNHDMTEFDVDPCPFVCERSSGISLANMFPGMERGLWPVVSFSIYVWEDGIIGACVHLSIFR